MPLDPNDLTNIEKAKTMAELWQVYSLSLYPTVEVDSVQYKETKQAFYAGALSLLTWMHVQIGESDDTDDVEIDKLQTIQDEITASLMAGVVTSLGKLNS